ncbi:MAG: NTP transferase domain-containing protein [Rhodobacteraceae bacterium]|uniref:nucleotidyltransferase family protein n=1 Tax=Celeribacter sp. HF31 TaxID=2721558 RepID=UPI001431C34A|nr:NTP transferase domain-containing protein [Celeribacter sp. HF31]NIY78521.1 NTP transferase domain-containing protein [Celeribacter sp. HF31]NVK47873.1 NTP transferase domain-containing protein [Paracoccaceae bacterium]
MKLLAGICAAGNSARMGFDKLSTAPSLHSPDTLLSRAVSAARGQPFVVALPAETHPYFQNRRDVLRPHDDFITVADSDLGISATLKALARYALEREADALAVIMADMPFITTSHLETLVILFETFGGTRIVRAQCQSGREGYPVIFPASVLPEFEALTGDEGVQVLVERHGAKRVEMPSEAPCWHVNTPEDWRQM